ncbi:MAG: PorT family protein [Tannerellaceae bacterium]|nr:PorT family protein [Tannerellaceae bacterium]
MKKFVTLILLFAAFQVSGQKFYFVPKVGLNIANLTKVEGSYRAGVTAGMGGELSLTEKFSLETGILYSMQGTKTSVTDEFGYTQDTKVTMDILNIPLLAKGYLAGGFNVFAGPQFGFNLSSTGTVDDEYLREKETEDIDYLFKSFALDLVMGLGYQWDAGFQVSAQYNLGLTNLFEDSPGGFDLYGKTRNSVFQINVGWRF